jgi:predicted short-subunit dehydrogenase-like oxidoreductase (DUF2520 family)
VSSKLNIVGIGAGKLAQQLLPQLQAVGYNILQVYNRSADKEEWVKKELKVSFTDQLSELNPDADVYLLMVSDDAIAYVSDLIGIHGAFVVHTSGSAGIMELRGLGVRRGVFYPLLSFAGQDMGAQWSETPILIEAQKKSDQVLLETMAEDISSRVMFMDSKQRGILHLSAVISQNFSNYLLSLAKRICAEHDVPFDLLMPLIMQSNERVSKGEDPAAMQTGPAIRKDVKTIDRHLELLREWPELREVYRILTASIQNFYRGR